MALDRLPSYTRKKPLSGGGHAYYWELPHWARPPIQRNGRTCPLVSTALGSDPAVMHEKARGLNEALAEWRKGAEGGGLAKGSVAWLFDWYRRQERFTSKAYKTRRDYHKLMDLLVDLETKKGAPRLGARPAAKVDAGAADRIYGLLKARGARQATYAMQVCRLVWGWAARHHRTTGVKENPFEGMGLRSTAAEGNRATTRAEYTAYRAAAHALGFPSMAAAAALAFECCQRVWDVFGFVDPDGVKARGFLWSEYRPGESITLRQSKTGKDVVLPLVIETDVEGAPWTMLLYPELMAELARAAAARRAGAAAIVVEERSGAPYKERRMSSVHRAICDKAGLPKKMTFTGFRHGGITEVGSVSADVRPISGHARLDTTRIYNKATAEKAREIAAARRAHVEALIGADELARA